MPDLDLKTFKPKDAEELAQGLILGATKAAADGWRNIRDVTTQSLQTLAVNAFHTQERLKKKEINQSEADFLMHMQELYLHQILLQGQFLSYVAVQDVLNAVFGIISAAIKNLTGIALNFGK